MRDCLGQCQRAQEVAEIVGESMKLKPDRVGSERSARQPRPLDRALAFLDPLLACAALIVEGDDILGGSRHVGDDEADPRNKLARMPLDFGDHPARLGPASGLIVEARMRPPHMVRGSPNRARQQIAQDLGEALKWYRMAAAQGDARAQFNIGWIYHHGRGLPPDAVEAAKWYGLAADQGNSHAQALLGLAYGMGTGVKEDHGIAAKWFRRAADQGEAIGQSALGIAYYRGLGVPQDFVIAHMWLNLAASSGGYKNAAKHRAKVSTMMTTGQIAEAQRLAREWRPKAER